MHDRCNLSVVTLDRIGDEFQIVTLVPGFNYNFHDPAFTTLLAFLTHGHTALP
jgi:hypothetical protein